MTIIRYICDGQSDKFLSDSNNWTPDKDTARFFMGERDARFHLLRHKFDLPWVQVMFEKV